MTPINQGQDTAQRRVFITGGPGFLGKQLLKIFPGAGLTPVGLNADITQAQALRDELVSHCPKDGDYFFHLAAISHVPTCETNPNLAAQVNVFGLWNVLSALKNTGAKLRFIFFSTAQVYQAPTQDEMDCIFDEDRNILPQNEYARTKRAGELLVMDAHRMNWIDGITLRLFNHSHKSQDPGFFLPHIYTSLKKALSGDGPLEIPIGNLELERDISTLGDFTGKVLQLVKHWDRLTATREPKDSYQEHRVFNLCSGQGKRLDLLANEMVTQMGVAARFKRDESRVRPGEPYRLVGNPKRWRTHFDSTASSSLESSPTGRLEKRMIQEFLKD